MAPKFHALPPRKNKPNTQNISGFGAEGDATHKFVSYEFWPLKQRTSRKANELEVKVAILNI